MYILKNKITGNYFVGDSLCWSPTLENATFYFTPETAKNHLKEKLPKIGDGVCGIYKLVFGENNGKARLILEEVS
jgi:hypothetical protein